MYPGTAKTQAIHINPDFKQKIRKCEEPPPTAAHINPKFIAAKPKSQTIHMNPEFLNATLKQQNANKQHEAVTQEILKTQAVIKGETKAQLHKTVENGHNQPQTKRVQEQQLPSLEKLKFPLVLLTKRKLVRATTETGGAAATTTTSTSTPNVKSTPIKRALRYKLVNKSYTIKRLSSLIKKRTVNSFIARFALRRGVDVAAAAAGGSNKLAPTVATAKKQRLITKSSTNKQLRLININGILYRSSQNKLQRRDEHVALQQQQQQPSLTAVDSKRKTLQNAKIVENSSPKKPKGRTVYVRGTKFILDPQGYKLTRINTTNVNSNVIIAAAAAALLPKQTQLSSNSASKIAQICADKFQPRRIDIGGRTYMASSSNIFVRTSTHLVLAHLNQAKQRSVSFLSRCLRKVNKPCAIYQRIGKCAAYERNRCSKIHDPKQVIVCPKFLHDECRNNNCLLSHNKSYQKMPVCKFFLQGFCVREDCLYLHKKLSNDAPICEDFRRGFCELGEKCNKQHIFPTPKSKHSQNNELAAGPPPRSQKKMLIDDGSRAEDTSSPINESAAALRYFSGEILDLAQITADETSVTEEPTSTAEADAGVMVKRQPLGSFPAFIPLT